MHIFLTGDIQIGKSTVIRKTLALLQADFGGFCTYFGPDRENPDRRLYIRDAALPPVYDEDHMIARFYPARPPQVFPEVFDRLGVKFIREGQKSKRLILMDECGRLERDALAFQNEVLGALDGKTPVLGVVAKSAGDWADRIRRHPKVRLITVDSDNRNSLPALLAEMISVFQ
jgi:nucleoside-triphosphatase